MRLATNESYLERATNTRKELVEWHSVVIWGKRAEALSKLLVKGERLYIEGALRTNSWDDQDGKKRYRTQIVARQVILCGARRADAPPAGGEEYEGRAGGGYEEEEPPEGAAGAAGEDDIPF